MSVITGLELVMRFALLEPRISFLIMRTLKKMFVIVPSDLSPAQYRWPRAVISQSFSGVGEKIEEEVAAALGADLKVVEEERL